MRVMVAVPWKQQRNLLFMSIISLLVMKQLMVVHHNSLASRKALDDTAAFVVSTTMNTQPIRRGNHHENQRNHNNVEYVSACLFFDETEQIVSSSDFVEWLAYHFHVLPLRYLIVAMNQTTTTSRAVRDVLDKYRSYYSSERTIVEWNDEDFMTSPIQSRHEELHIPTRQERRGVFHYRCAQTLNHYHRHVAYSKSGWTWMANSVHEYLVVNPNDGMIGPPKQPQRNGKSNIPTPLQEPGLVLRSLKSWGSYENETMMDAKLLRSSLPSSATTTTACLEMETWDAISNGQGNPQAHQNIPSLRALNTSAFRTWQFQGGRRQVSTGHPRLLDLTRIPTGDILPHDHHPFPFATRTNNSTVCRNVGFMAVLRDSGYPQKQQQQQSTTTKEQVTPGIISNDAMHLDLHPWTLGFVQTAGESVAMDLLGDFKKKSKGSIDHNHPARPTHVLEERCAILFFGLPRSYDTMVLPSITKNILLPNARHNCDVYVHYYYMTAEPAGRKNKGGAMDPTAVLKLADAVRLVARNYSTHGSNDSSVDSPSLRQRQQRVPHVEFTHDTDEAFWHLRNRTVQKYRNTKDENGNYLYFPYKVTSYVYPSSLDNIVKQWHSIESVWNLMERAMRQGIANYTRVALFRNDVMFVTPIDIYRTSFDDQKDDVEGRHAVVPPFGLYPVNDRLVYGSYKATKIWATKRFDYIEDHVRNHPSGPGYGMQSESFLQKSIFVAMRREAGVNVTMNPDICFFRTRADNTAMISDCNSKGKTRGIDSMPKEQVIKEISGFTNCTTYSMGYPFKAVTCKK